MKKTDATQVRNADFSKAKRARAVPHLRRLARSKTRITIMLDDEVLAAFRNQAEKQGIGYQTLINHVLQNYLARPGEPLTTELVRKIVREELRKSA